MTIMEVSPIHIKKYIRQALKDNRLRESVYKATVSTEQTSQITTAQIPYWEDLRQKLHAIKKDVIDNLDAYLELFETNCEKNGIQVHWTVDEKEARQIVLALAKDNNVKKIVKSKSLTTEEIQLNKCLQDNDIEVLETDLGEYIVQLKGQMPSHLIAPALHLSRKDIGELFQEKLGTPYTDDPNELLTIARSRLRESFLTADMGISGVNFAIADSGCFCVIENEANAHLSISLPRIHIAVMGIEKLLPTMKSLPYFLKALAPRATGQKASTYVNFVGGPSRERYGEGPEEVHIVLLDNGRSKILQDPQLRETLFCIRCGSCLNICPIYQQIGGYAYGWIYMGPIGITMIPQYLGESIGRYAPYLSSLCGACFDICPMKIDIPSHLLKLRNLIVETGHTKMVERIGMSLWAFLAKHPALYRFTTWFPGKLQKLLPKGKALPIPGYTGARAFASFDSKGFRKRFYKFMDKNKLMDR